MRDPSGRLRLAVTALFLLYSAVHFAESGVRFPLAAANLTRFAEQTPPLREHLRTGAPVHNVSPIQYGPVFFFVMHPLLRLTHGDPVALMRSLYALQLLCIAVGFVATCATLRRLAWAGDRRSWLLVVAWLAVLWLNFSPLYTTMGTLSVETWELALMALALYAYVRDRPWIAACAIAAAGLIKLLPFIFAFYWLLRDRRTFGRFSVALFAFLLLGHVLYGPEMGLAYLVNRTGTTFGASFAMLWHENISLKGAIAKCFGHLREGTGYYLALSPTQFTAAILLGDLMLVGLGIRLAMILLRGEPSRRPELVLWEWSFVASAMLVLSPNSAMEYITLMLGACSYALVRVVALEPSARAAVTSSTLAAAMLLMGALLPRQVLNRLTPIGPLTRLAGTTFLTPSEAYQFFCFPLLGLILLGVTIWRVRPATTPAMAKHARAGVKWAAAIAAVACSAVVAGCPVSTPYVVVEKARVEAEHGSASAQYAVGRAHACGVGAVRDDGQAVAWLRRAADQNLADAEFDLATLYLWGRGLPRDRVEFAAWTRRAAEHGLARAQRRLGAAYAAGIGVDVDDVAAVQWYEKAASSGDAAARALLADAAARRLDIRRSFDSTDIYLAADANFRAARNGSGYALLAGAAGRWTLEQIGALVGSSRCLDPR